MDTPRRSPARSARLAIRCSVTERALLRRAARVAGCSVSDLLRRGGLALAQIVHQEGPAAAVPPRERKASP